MKKTILSSILAVLACTAANASDGGVYTEETFTNHVVMNFDVVEVPVPAPVAKPAPRPCTKCGACGSRVASSVDVARPCPRAAANPVRVKTHTEVIDHYQVYQPVTVYQPVGEYAERRVVANPVKPCNRCGF